MEAASGAETLQAGALQIRPAEFAAFAHGRPLALTARELRVLSALARRPERIVAREELFAVVWDRPFREGDRLVDVYVSKVREKLERALPEWRYIHTHFGFGYRFEAEPLHPFNKLATGR